MDGSAAATAAAAGGAGTGGGDARARHSVRPGDPARRRPWSTSPGSTGLDKSGALCNASRSLPESPTRSLRWAGLLGLDSSQDGAGQETITAPESSAQLIIGQKSVQPWPNGFHRGRKARQPWGSTAILWSFVDRRVRWPVSQSFNQGGAAPALRPGTGSPRLGAPAPGWLQPPARRDRGPVAAPR